MLISHDLKAQLLSGACLLSTVRCSRNTTKRYDLANNDAMTLQTRISSSVLTDDHVLSGAITDDDAQQALLQMNTSSRMTSNRL